MPQVRRWAWFEDEHRACRTEGDFMGQNSTLWSGWECIAHAVIQSMSCKSVLIVQELWVRDAVPNSMNSVQGYELY